MALYVPEEPVPMPQGKLAGFSLFIHYDHEPGIMIHAAINIAKETGITRNQFSSDGVLGTSV